jgi:hypothetical protein
MTMAKREGRPALPFAFPIRPSYIAFHGMTFLICVVAPVAEQEIQMFNSLKTGVHLITHKTSSYLTENKSLCPLDKAVNDAYENNCSLM